MEDVLQPTFFGPATPLDFIKHKQKSFPRPPCVPVKVKLSLIPSLQLDRFLHLYKLLFFK